MFRFICKTHAEKQRTIDLNMSYVRYLECLSSISKPNEQQSLTVSFLTNSCGLSLEKAISVSKRVNIQKPKKPNSVIKLLTSYGFSKSQIATLISKYPHLILADPAKSLKPKIDYFISLGISGPSLPKFLCSNSNIFRRSLENKIIPLIEFFRRFVQTNENLVNALKQSNHVISCDIEKQMVPNINTLQENGVPEPHIARLIMLQPSSLILRVDLFKNVVVVIKEMGFEPTSLSFILAVRSMSIMKKSIWEEKKYTLMSFGLSEDQFNLAFRKQPMLMICSAKKISKLMDFFVTKVGLQPSDIVRCPNLLLLSLEKRILPRWSVIKVLMSKSLLKKDVDVIWAFNGSKQDFEKRYVARYMHDNPEVMRAYQGVLGSQC